jgi:hypothetical protein
LKKKTFKDCSTPLVDSITNQSLSSDAPAMDMDKKVLLQPFNQKRRHNQLETRKAKEIALKAQGKEEIN